MKNKLNIPTRPKTVQRPTASAPQAAQNPPGKRPSVMIAVPAMEMVNAETIKYAQSRLEKIS